MSERWQRLLTHEASSRTAGMLRIGLALIALSRFADEMLPLHSHSPARLVFGVLFYASTLWLLVGYKARAAAACAGVIQLAMGFVVGIHHHTYLLAVATLLLSLTPCGRSYSIDRWRSREPERGLTYGLVLIALQVTAIYFWGILNKFDWLYLSGVRMEQFLLYFHFGSDFTAPSGLRALSIGLSIASIVVEAVLIVGLWVRRWHKWVLPLGIVFHAVVYYTLRVDTFTVQMWLLYLVFIDPDAVHRVLDEVH